MRGIPISTTAWAVVVAFIVIMDIVVVDAVVAVVAVVVVVVVVVPLFTYRAGLSQIWLFLMALGL
mgnify:CR=1 FL=1